MNFYTWETCPGFFGGPVTFINSTSVQKGANGIMNANKIAFITEGIPSPSY